MRGKQALCLKVRGKKEGLALRGESEYRKTARNRKAKEQLGVVRKRFCRYCKEGGINFDYKDIKRFEKFVSERGKILSRRYSGNCAKHQRKIATLIKRARFLALMPYTK